MKQSVRASSGALQEGSLAEARGQRLEPSEGNPTLSIDQRTDWRNASIWAIAFSVILGAWAVVSPVGASADEPAHIAYAWGLATGQPVLDIPDCDPTSRGCAIPVSAPLGLIPSPECHAFSADAPASCEGPRTITRFGTRTIRYPPPYYMVVGLGMRASVAAGASGQQAGLVGRFVGVLIAVSILTPAFVLAIRSAPNVVPFLIVGLTPISLFMSSSVNPNGAEICAAIAASVGVVVFATSQTTGRLALGTFLYGLTWLAWARPLGFLWAGALVLFGSLYVHAASGRKASEWRASVRQHADALRPAILSTLVAMAWFVFALQVRGVGESDGASTPDPGLERLLAVPLRWGGIGVEAVGILGWLRTPLPLVVVLTVVGCLSSMLVVASLDQGVQKDVRRVVRNYCIIIVLGISAIMIQTAFLWQGRYALAPLLTCLVLWGGTAAPGLAALTRRLALTSWFASCGSIFWVLARYRYGLQSDLRYVIPNFSEGGSWSPAPGLLGTLLLGLVAIAAVPVALRLTSAVSLNADDQEEGSLV